MPLFIEYFLIKANAARLCDWLLLCSDCKIIGNYSYIIYECVNQCELNSNSNLKMNVFFK